MEQTGIPTPLIFMNQQSIQNSASPREYPLPLDDITGAIVDAALKEGLDRIVNNLPTSASPRLPPSA